ncbi:unnamed protein product [Heligmosomoides polygyrus]|uniref:DUF3768 domain-containing protein n=1 Tax=Heligmosomoides polygyrus TaxID=6339 RepID=A0A183GH78_HELPZ|nr:unnamed protein product [Heligmosomoides polygyrus]
MANHGPSYGLSRELEKKNQLRRLRVGGFAAGLIRASSDFFLGIARELAGMRPWPTGFNFHFRTDNQARFSLEEAVEVLLWVESVTQMPYANDPATCRTAADVAELLKDGVHLCK